MHSYSDWTQVFFFDANKRKVVRSVSCPGECRCVLFLPAGRFSVVSFPSEAAVPPGLIQRCCATSAIHCVSSAVCLGCRCRASECSRVVPASESVAASSAFLMRSSVAFSPDGRHLAVGLASGQVRSHQKLARPLRLGEALRTFTTFGAGLRP